MVIDMQKMVIDFLSEYCNLKDESITGESKLILDLGISSFELLDLCSQIEDTFDMRIRDENLAKIITIDDVVKYLEKC
ncbi:MAG: phosphopantetheine-binding protein [Oscillospiraceae bacterium]|nr:phosphopantetheine-binding protein [Oscillospiraceae bacterium]